MQINVSFECLAEKHRHVVIDILNYYIKNTTSAYREAMVGYEHFDNFLKDDGILVFYAIKYVDEIIGFCTLEYFKNIINFHQIGDVMYFLKPEYTGKGIGQKVLLQLEQDAIHNGMKKIVVDISDENSGSISFHKKNGFVEYGRLKNCWKKFGKELGIVFLQKELL